MKGRSDYCKADFEGNCSRNLKCNNEGPADSRPSTLGAAAEN